MKGPVKRTLTGYAFLAPWLFSLCFFIGYPFFASLYFSLCDLPPLQAPAFIGAENYMEILGDSVFQRSLGITFIYAAFAIPLGVAAALTLAILLNTRIRGLTFYRVIFYLPHLVPTVAVAVLWLWIFNPTFGLINVILRLLTSVMDGWTGIFFDLGAAFARENFITPASIVLLVPAILSLLLWGPKKIRLRLPESPLIEFAERMIVVGLAMSTILFLYASAHFIDPTGMSKLHSPGWLSDGSVFPTGVPFAPPWALWALIIMSLWGVGQMAIIYLAKLQDVPVELYEAADIDGANWFQKTRQITIPMISPVILFNVVMAIIGTFQIFAEPYIMTGGGPEDKTRFVAMFIYDQAFRYQRLGYASAVAWVLFIIIVAMTVLAFRISSRHVYYEGR